MSFSSYPSPLCGGVLYITLSLSSDCLEREDEYAGSRSVLIESSQILSLDDHTSTAPEWLRCAYQVTHYLYSLNRVHLPSFFVVLKYVLIQILNSDTKTVVARVQHKPSCLSQYLNIFAQLQKQVQNLTNDPRIQAALLNFFSTTLSSIFATKNHCYLQVLETSTWFREVYQWQSWAGTILPSILCSNCAIYINSDIMKYEQL